MTLVEQTCREVHYDFRKRKITPVVTVLHMIMSAIWLEDSFNACWQVLWDTFFSWFPQFKGQSPSRRRVAEARGRLPLRLWRELFQKVAQQAQGVSCGYDAWHGQRVVLVDGTCLSMGRTPELVKAFGVNKGYHGWGRYPLARLVTLCLAGTMTILDYAVGRYTQGEWLPPGFDPRIAASGRSVDRRPPFCQCSLLCPLPDRGPAIPHACSSTAEDSQRQTRDSIQHP